jgi:hypothetical protein
MIVAVGIAAAWFEYSYRRNRHAKKDTHTAQSGAAKKNLGVSSRPAEESSNSLKVASSQN